MFRKIAQKVKRFGVDNLFKEVIIAKDVELQEHIEQIELKNNQLNALRQAIARTEKEREYWYNLWFSMCSEFQVTQDIFIQRIERLGEKLAMSKKESLQGIPGDNLEAFKKHPSVRVKTELESINCPPKSHLGE